MTNQVLDITTDLAHRLIGISFPEFTNLPIVSVEKQGHDNRTYRLGSGMLIRMPTAQSYALKVPKERELLPKLAPYLTASIPVPIKMGTPTNYYPYPFSIYEWLPGTSINLLKLDNKEQLYLALDLAKFLKELQSITNIDGPIPGQHNWWRGAHLSVYDQGAREQMAKLVYEIDFEKSMNLWEQACNTKWNEAPVWIHGDFAIGNILVNNGKLSAIIDFGGMALGDPACDVVIAWTYFEEKARETFIQKMALDDYTWLRARGWALWKATYELCQVKDKNSAEALTQKRIIDEIMQHYLNYFFLFSQSGDTPLRHFVL